MTDVRFYDFPLAYLGTHARLEAIPFADDPYGIRLVELPRDRAEIYSHFGCPYVFEVTRRPDWLDYPQPTLVPDWKMYVRQAKHARRLFHDHLIELVNRLEVIWLCASEYDLEELDWNGGRPADWTTIDIVELRDGRFKGFRWGDSMPEQDWDLKIVKTA